MWKLLGKTSTNVSQVINGLEIDVKNGNPILDKLRYVFITDEEKIIYMLTPFDLADLDPKPEIKVISLYSSI